MDRRQRQVIDSYERSQAFVDTHPLAGEADYGAPKLLLDGIVERLASHCIAQESDGRMERGAVITQRMQARRLREVHLRSIAQVARSLVGDVPELHTLLRLPRGQVTAGRLIPQARAIRELAAAHEELLSTNGCGADFLAELDGAIAALEAIVVQRSLSYGARVAAGQGIIAEIRRGRDAVRMIDAIVRRRFADQPDVLAEWRNASRVRGPQGGGARRVDAVVEGAVPPRTAVA